MPTQSKPKKVGRPKLPKGEAKGKLVALRFKAEDLKRINAAAKANKQTLSEWIRSTLNTAMEAEG
jgi:predicted HicB family RNase H-like nuclease